LNALKKGFGKLGEKLDHYARANTRGLDRDQ
jgi:hypothetical protein